MTEKLAKYFFFLCLVLSTNIPFGATAQNKDLQLAEEYYQQEDFEKAKVLYERLARSNRNLPFIYKNYLQTLLRLQAFSEADRLVKRQIKNQPENPVFQIDEGRVLNAQQKIEKAQEIYEEVINRFRKASRTTVINAAEHFARLGEMGFARDMLLAARKASGDKGLYAEPLAEIYEVLDQKDLMIEEYLLVATSNNGRIDYVKSALQDRLSAQEEYDNLEKILLERLQKNSNEVTYNEILLWLYLQQKRFYRAFIQAKALDRRYRMEGNELLNIGMISMQNEDYKSAKTIFEYIINTYPNSSNYSVARNAYIKAQEEIVKNTFPIQEEAIYALIDDYKNLIQEIGKNYKTFDSFRNMALLYAFYLDQKDTAIAILEEAIAISRGRVDFIAKCKLNLGDIYLLKNEPWEATLLYSQVEKLKKEHPLGYNAKLKNAKLSFYKGDFLLSQEHLDILKEATTREIANDAMDLSLLIQDNLAFDTTGKALQEYANIELLVFQNKNFEALNRLDTMLVKFPGHSIQDEVLWNKANLLLKLGKPQDAAVVLERIYTEHGEDILGDDAYFLLGKINEEQLGNKEKAQEIYKDLIIKYPGSIYTAESRKRFRILRGDFVN